MKQPWPFVPEPDENILMQGRTYVLTDLRLVWRKGKETTVLSKLQPAGLAPFGGRNLLIVGDADVECDTREEAMRLFNAITLGQERRLRAQERPVV